MTVTVMKENLAGEDLVAAESARDAHMAMAIGYATMLQSDGADQQRAFEIALSGLLNGCAGFIAAVAPPHTHAAIAANVKSAFDELVATAASAKAGPSAPLKSN